MFLNQPAWQEVLEDLALQIFNNTSTRTSKLAWFTLTWSQMRVTELNEKWYTAFGLSLLVFDTVWCDLFNLHTVISVICLFFLPFHLLGLTYYIRYNGVVVNEPLHHACPWSVVCKYYYSNCCEAGGSSYIPVFFAFLLPILIQYFLSMWSHCQQVILHLSSRGTNFAILAVELTP